MTGSISHPRRAARVGLFVALVVLVGTALLASCKYGAYFFQIDQDSPDERTGSLTMLSGRDLPDIGTDGTYSFVVITDAHFGAAHSRSDDAFISWFTAQLASADTTQVPRFVVNLGDTLNAGRSDEADDFNAFAAQLQKAAADVIGDNAYKVYSILGNHDLYNEGWSVWKKEIYPYTSYYGFSLAADSTTDGFSFYFLDSGNGTLGESQLSDFTANLATDARPKIVFSHYAVYAGGIVYYTLQDTMERNLLITAFVKNNVKYVFEGHAHSDHTYTWDTFSERVTPSFLYDDCCCLVTVSESDGAVTSRLVYF